MTTATSSAPARPRTGTGEDGGRIPGQRRGRRRRRKPVLDLPGVLAPVRILAAPLPAGLPGGEQLAVA